MQTRRIRRGRYVFTLFFHVVKLSSSSNICSFSFFETSTRMGYLLYMINALEKQDGSGFVVPNVKPMKYKRTRTWFIISVHYPVRAAFDFASLRIIVGTHVHVFLYFIRVL